MHSCIWVHRARTAVPTVRASHPAPSRPNPIAALAGVDLHGDLSGRSDADAVRGDLVETGECVERGFEAAPGRLPFRRDRARLL